MAEEVGIVMTLYDRVSPTLKDLSKNTKAFDKDLDDLEQSLKTFDKNQQGLVSRSAELKKALEGANQRVTDARKEYRKLKDETSKGALDEAIEEQQRLKQALDETSIAIKENNQNYKALLASARTAAAEASKAENKAEGGMLRQLRTAGLFSLAGDAVSQLGGVLVESALGQPMASFVGSTLSGAASGAAIGSVLGPTGTLLGAAVGAASGVANGFGQVYQAQDEAFKSYVQESVEGQLEEMESVRTSGSATAGQREQDQIAFAQRFGSDEAARSYLDQVRAMAVNTNYTYDEITGYSKNLLNSYSPEETLGVLQTLSDATAGLNLDSSGVSMFIAGLSRMRTTGKVTQEYLNYFSERGLDVYDALARSTGADKSQIAGMVTDGDISGTQAAQAILDYIQEEFGGLSEKLASTYDAMVDNLGDAEANLNARMGEGYNEARKSGLEAQQAWLESDQLGDAYEAIGAWKAELENAKEQYIRDAVNDAMSSEEYQAAQAAGDAAEMGRIIMQAKIRGMGEYNANEGKDEELAQELALIEGVREDAALNDAYWDAGYTLGQAFSKGRLAGMKEDILSWSSGIEGPEVSDSTRNTYMNALAKRQSREEGSHAAGLGRVPYDNYAALLHEGERVLTASQARELDRGGSGGGVTVNLSGSWTVRSEEDAEELAEILVRKIELAQKAGVIG